MELTLELQLHLLAQVTLAAFLSMVVGLDRERRDKSAGLRTHMLTGLGACLFTTIGSHALPEADPTRVAAGVVTGIGFLGAGVIIKAEDGARDLTTSASIWATAAIGVAVALDAWLLSIGATVLIWFILAVVQRWEMSMARAGNDDKASAKDREDPEAGQS
jgi:putative Mg2+ transporter-C (MgtC) family protein